MFGVRIGRLLPRQVYFSVMRAVFMTAGRGKRCDSCGLQKVQASARSDAAGCRLVKFAKQLYDKCSNGNSTFNLRVVDPELVTFLRGQEK